MSGQCYSPDGVNPTLTCVHDACNKIVVPVGNLYDSKGQAGNVYDSQCSGPCLPGFGAGGGGKELKVAIPVLTPDRATKRQNGRRFKEDGEEAFTLTGQDRHGVAIKVVGCKPSN